jgi:hypothetical protein
MLSCVRSTRCPCECSRCRRPLAGREAHLPIFYAGVYCGRCCPACRQDPAEAEDELKFQEEERE